MTPPDARARLAEQRVVLDRGECRHCRELIVLLGGAVGVSGKRFVFWAHDWKDGVRLVLCWSPYAIVPGPAAAPRRRVRARRRRLVRQFRGPGELHPRSRSASREHWEMLAALGARERELAARRERAEAFLAYMKRNGCE
ncbi:hypothetical protein [Nonomuraea glycinis]|uniref:hypothetical protein n=1 Tax=Nonomuraea glycinis TaxID=2047744 RepID=UPI0033BEA0E0